MTDSILISEEVIDGFKRDLDSRNSEMEVKDLEPRDTATTIGVNTNLHKAFDESITIITNYKNATAQEIKNLSAIANEFSELDSSIANGYSG